MASGVHSAPRLDHVGEENATAIWFVGRREPWRRWGYILGLIAQPFWYWTTIEHEQWGICALSVWYTYSWAQGVWNYWIRPQGRDA